MGKIYKPSLVYYENAFHKNKAVAVENGIIKDIDDSDIVLSKYKAFEEVAWPYTAMLPGTVNVHNHSFQSLLRGIAADKPFLEWRDKALYKFSPILTAEDIYIGALFAFGEMLRYGVTTVSDFFYVHNNGVESDEAVIKAAEDLGIRLVLARTMYDWDGAPKGYRETVKEAVDNTKKLAKKYQGNRMTKIIPAPHSLHAASLDMIKAGHKLAQELDTTFHIHVAEEPFEVEQVQAEYNLRPVELLNKIGVVDERMVAIHEVWLNKEEIQIMGKNKAKLAYCPSSNMFLADGITDIPEMLNAKVNVGLGSDGACSNNRISIFEEMRMAALLQKVSKLDTTAISAKQAFDMGTKNGERILGLPVGEIKIGYNADFVGVDLRDLSLQPLFSDYEQLLPNIVYSMQPNAISHVVVDGVERVSNGHILSVTEDKILDKVQGLMAKLKKQA